MTQDRLDDKYTSGVWYDMMAGDYCKIQESDEGDVELVTPDGDDVFAEVDIEDWVASEHADFREVPQAAVERPAEYLEEILDVTARDASPSVEDRIGLSYVRQQKEITVD